MTSFQAGIGEVDITPEKSLRVAGMLNPPVVSKARWRLYGRVFTFAANDNLCAIVCLDNLFLAAPLISEFRQIVHASPIPPENIFISCTHTHRAPYTAPIMDQEIDFDYFDFMTEKIRLAVQQSLKTLQPASLVSGHIQAPGWTFNRRQVYRSTFYNQQVGTQGPQNEARFLHNEGPEDNEIKILHILDLEGKSLGGCVNFACHPTVMGGEAVYSADYPGPLTEALTARLGGIFGFLLGAAGNLWSIDTSQEKHCLEKDFTGPEHALSMGHHLADKCIESLKDAQPFQPTSIHCVKKCLTLPQRRVPLKAVQLAHWYLEHRPADLDQAAFTREITGREYTFYGHDPEVQEWFARETIGLWEYQRRSSTRQILENVEIQVITLGDIAFVGYPGEIFTEFGLATKAQSPFPQTFVVELANGWHGYIPTLEAFNHGGYETRLGSTSRLAEDGGNRMVAVAMQLLQEIRRSP